MAIAERIRFFRTKCGMTLKYFGMALGFPEKSSDIRIVQYENGSRESKADLTASMAKVLGVSPRALKVPDIDTDLGLMHTLFTLEDTRGFKIGKLDGIRFSPCPGRDVAIVLLRGGEQRQPTGYYSMMIPVCLPLLRNNHTLACCSSISL